MKHTVRVFVSCEKAFGAANVSSLTCGKESPSRVIKYVLSRDGGIETMSMLVACSRKSRLAHGSFASSGIRS